MTLLVHYSFYSLLHGMKQLFKIPLYSTLRSGRTNTPFTHFRELS